MNELDKYLKQVFAEAAKILPDLEYDHMAGVWSIVMSADRMMYCTPFYEDVNGIALAVVDIEGETVDTDNLPYKLTNHDEIDALEFVKQIKLYLFEKGEI